MRLSSRYYVFEEAFHINLDQIDSDVMVGENSSHFIIIEYQINTEAMENLKPPELWLSLFCCISSLPG